MLKKILFFSIYAFLFIFVSCQEKNDRRSFLAQIKEYEYNRDTTSENWRALLNKASNLEERRKVLLSVSHTRNAQLLTFYKTVFNNAKDDSLKKLALFAIGQTRTKEAEKNLLNIPIDSLSATMRNVFFLSLSRCCSEESLPFIMDALKQFKSEKSLPEALALCSKSPSPKSGFIPGVIDTSGGQPITDAQAYFLNRVSTFGDIPLLIRELSGAKGLAKKYLFKSLYKKSSTDSSRFRKILESDSTAFFNLSYQISEELKSKANWRLTFYALALSPFVADSSYYDLYKPLLNDKNIHLKVSAWKAYANCLPDGLSASLLSALAENKKNNYFRSELLKILAQHKPELAYSLIMKELGEGNSFDKASLLVGLSFTKLPRAIATIRQFLHVPDTRLVNEAYMCLSDLKRLSALDVKRMLQSSSNSSVGTALDKHKTSKKYLKNKQLFEIYKNFNTLPGLEIQKTILSIFKNRSVDIDSIRKNILFSYACHPVILRQLKSDFLLEKDAVVTPGFLLPGYLQPDSICLYSENPIVEISTSKGRIHAELYANWAPLTVQSFLRLSQKNFYDDLFFHRVIPDFVIQGGDPQGDGWGGPDYLIPSEDNPLPFRRGSIGMATAGFDTGGSQFFICQSEQPHLNGNYTLFGKVIKGMHIVDNIVPGDKILKIDIKN